MGMFKPVKLLDVELTEPLTDLRVPEPYGSVRALIRLRGVPIGVVELQAWAGVVEGAAVRRAAVDQLNWPLIRRHLIGLISRTPATSWSIEDLVGADPGDSYAGPWPSVSVVVCTRNRPDDIRLCVEALLQLEYAGPLELIVVDNAPSDDSTRQLIADQFPGVRYAREERPGLDWARNRGIAEARHEIVAYTDDDVIVDRLWVQGLARVFAQNPGVAGVSGLVAPYELETSPQAAFEQYGGFGRGYRQQWFVANLAGGELAANNFLGTGKFGTGANMAYRRSAFSRIGVFDPALDVGTMTNGGGDLEMFFRVVKAGFPMVYEPRAMVRHRHRRDYGRLRTQIENNGIGFYAYVVRCFLAFPEERLVILRFGLWWFWYWSVFCLLKSFAGRWAFRSRDLIWAELTGSIRGLRRYQQARRHAAALARPDDPPPVITEPAQTGRGLKPHGQAVRYVDIACPLEPLTDVSAYPVVRLTVQRDGELLGTLEIVNGYQPVSVERLAEAIVDHLQIRLIGDESLSDTVRWSLAKAAMLAHYAAAPISRPALPADQPVSVVIATYDRPDDLRECLASVTRQRTSRELEVVVVDNNPASGLTPPVVAGFPGVRLVSETRKGLSYARNAGISVARGSIIVMTDDDVVAPEGWLERLVAPFARPDVMIVTGNVLPLQIETKAQRFFELYGGLGRGFSRIEAGGDWFYSFARSAVPTWSLGATANAAFRATIFADPRIGLLDEALGAGTPTGCSEDTYIFYRTLKSGYTLWYEPQAYVRHRHRSDMAALRRQIYNYSKGHVAYHLLTALREGDRRALLQVGVLLPKWHVRRFLGQLRLAIRGRNDYPLSLSLLEMLGNLAGPFALLQSLRRVRQLGHSAPYMPPTVVKPEGVISQGDNPSAEPVVR